MKQFKPFEIGELVWVYKDAKIYGKINSVGEFGIYLGKSYTENGNTYILTENWHRVFLQASLKEESFTTNCLFPEWMAK